MISMTLLMCVDFSDTKYSLFGEFLPWCFMMCDTIMVNSIFLTSKLLATSQGLPFTNLGF